jgi:hypothetical protein
VSVRARARKAPGGARLTAAACWSAAAIGAVG